MKRILLGLLTAGLLAASTGSTALSSDRDVCDSDKSTPDQTIRACSRIIGRNPNDAVAYYNRGIGYKNRNDYTSAIADYSRAIEINPSYALAYNNRCAVYNKTEKYDLAIRDCTKALKIRPNYANAYAGRAVAYEGKGDIQSAIEDYRSALAADPNYLLALDALERLGARPDDGETPRSSAPSAAAAGAK